MILSYFFKTEYQLLGINLFFEVDSIDWVCVNH
jgi:hypothetical protein